MNKTEELIVKVAREVSEIHGTIPHLATKEYVDDAVQKAVEAKRIVLNGKQIAALVSAVVGLIGAVTSVLYAIA
jgi:hypothetical protein